MYVRVRRELYEALAERVKAKSPEELVERLMLEKLSDLMFGIDKGKLKPFSEEDRMEDRGW